MVTAAENEESEVTKEPLQSIKPFDDKPIKEEGSLEKSQSGSKTVAKFVSPLPKAQSGPNSQRKKQAAGELSRRKLIDNTDQVNTDLIVCDNTDRSLLDTYRKEQQRSVNLGETT